MSGKTSLTQQYLSPPTYQDAYFPTIESTAHKSVTFGGLEYDCEIIDSAGQVSLTSAPPVSVLTTGRIHPVPE